MSADPSSFDPSSLDCDEALERIYEFLDGELTEEVERAIRQHLAVCSRCEPKFAHERVFLELIAQRTRLESAPPELRRRILRELIDAAKRREEK